MSISEKAIEIHDRGFNCAQSVLAALGEYTGLDEKTALSISAGFGGGVRCGEICGSICGAVMAVGLANPFCDGNDAAAKNSVAVLSKECTNAFKEKYGCVRCLDLKKMGKPCSELIGFGAEVAEKIIINNK